MNAYVVDAGEVVADCGCGVDGCLDGSGPLVDIVFAETPSKARYAFWKHYRRDLDALHEVPWRVRKLPTTFWPSMPWRDAGLLDTADMAVYRFLWQMVDRLVPPFERAARPDRVF